MYEHRKLRPLSFAAFLARVGRHAALSSLILLGSLLVGMAGYQYFEHLNWRDAFLNASMLLGGMGPVESPQSDGGKLFAGLYALYCGVVFIGVSGIMLAPLAHRVLHRFHWEQSEHRND